MKAILLSFILITILVLSTKSVGSANAIQEDSVLKIITLIKKCFEAEKDATIRIEVTNRHNGTYVIISDLKQERDSIELRSHIKDMIGGERDTVSKLTMITFGDRLKGATAIDDVLKIAGHFQTIRIKKGKEEFVFGTTEGRGLMNFLELRDK